ncbi:hypothetical protein ACU610_13585 [Geodermatophilus sp. URMC 61]|uniref:hypothetical protein n=1 Tax=Geodermatophilus sp. URMC 61 TaxID=3423411 RepID=UPI00406C0CFE
MSSVPAARSHAAPQAVAFCPCPPLLVPAVAGRAAADTAVLRAACAAAVDTALATRPEVVVVVGGEDGCGRFGAGDGGDLRGYGVDLDVPFAGRARPGGRRTPLAHTIGAWLLHEAGYAGHRLGVGPADLADVLGDLPGPVAVLAVGDGSARRSLKAPGHLDPTAQPFDDAVAAALAAGDPDTLAVLDPAEGARLLAAGVPTWRAVGAALAGREVSGRLHAHEAPFGVAYLVADWSVR